MKRSNETWIISKVKYYWAFCSKTTQGLSAILKNIYPAHEHQRFHDAFDVISLSQSAVFPPCPHAHKEIYCFQSLTAFIRDFQRAKDKKKHRWPFWKLRYLYLWILLVLIDDVVTIFAVRFQGT